MDECLKVLLGVYSCEFRDGACGSVPGRCPVSAAAGTVPVREAAGRITTSNAASQLFNFHSGTIKGSFKANSVELTL
jgi:hypothetical protein